MKVLNYILGIAVFTLAYEWTKWSTYRWMKQTLCFLRRLPSWGTICWALILGSLNVKSMIPRSHGIWMNDMKEAMWYMLCAMVCTIWRCYVLCAIWYLWWCMLLSWHDIPKLNLASPLTWLSINHVVKKELFLLMHVFGVCLHIPILSTSVY